MNVPLHHGWLIIDKPTGITSFDVVRQVRKLLQIRKIGHAGTLDPLATGILPLALGDATKAIPFCMDFDKEYHCTFTLGIATDTDDSEGRAIAHSSHMPTEEELKAVLSHFRGVIEQVPPQYSAIKIAGKRAYALARQGEEVNLIARKVTINTLELLAYHPSQKSVEIVVSCSKGTYIRSIVRDIGQKLGCFAHVTALRRTRVGKFTLNQTILLETLKEIVHTPSLHGHIVPLDIVLDDIPALIVTQEEAKRLSQGQALSLSLPSVYHDTDQACAKYQGQVIAWGAIRNAIFKPKRVLLVK